MMRFQYNNINNILTNDFSFILFFFIFLLAAPTIIRTVIIGSSSSSSIFVMGLSDNDEYVTTKTKIAELIVMTRNLYLGTNITSQLEAASTAGETTTITNDFFYTLTNMWIEISDYSDIESRMLAIAKEIYDGFDFDKVPDLIGLQEAYVYTITDSIGFYNNQFDLYEDLDYKLDMVQILIEKLQEEYGLNYRIASYSSNLALSLLSNTTTKTFVIPSTNIDGTIDTPECNVPIPANEATPLLGYEIDFDFCLWSIYYDYNNYIILVNIESENSGKITLTDNHNGTFVNQKLYPSPLDDDENLLSFHEKRGWTYIDGIIYGSSGEQQSFRFINTHLEIDDEYNILQAIELFEVDGPAAAANFTSSSSSSSSSSYNNNDENMNTTLILVGTFNSAGPPPPPPADNNQDNHIKFGSSAYNYIVNNESLQDVWLIANDDNDNDNDNGYTYGQSPTLDNPNDISYVRIDHIFLSTANNNNVSVGNTQVTGNTRFRRVPPFWASDHFGIISTIQFNNVKQIIDDSETTSSSSPSSSPPSTLSPSIDDNDHNESSPSSAAADDFVASTNTRQGFLFGILRRVNNNPIILSFSSIFLLYYHDLL